MIKMNILKLLNKNDFHFKEIEPNIIADNYNRIICQIVPNIENFNPESIIHKDLYTIVAFANKYQIRFYSSESFDPMNMLYFWDYNGKFDLETLHNKTMLLDNSTINYYNDLCKKYNIELQTLIDKLMNNEDITEITNPFDRQMLAYTVVDLVDGGKNYPEVKEKSNRTTGEFYTKMEIVQEVHDLVKKYCDPRFILEPFAGAGNLIIPFKDECSGILNDIKPNEKLKEFGEKWKVYENDFISNTQWRNIIIHDINVDNTRQHRIENITILTNPPFGTVMTNQLASKKDEQQIRKLDISYPEDVVKYGRGDLILPTIGKCIEVIKELGYGHLCFFSPVGIYCNRKRYNKLRDALLKDFEFLYGKIYSGDKFEGVNRNKAIAFTIYRYVPNINESIGYYAFDIIGSKKLSFIHLPLLKDVWKYYVGETQIGELIAPRCDTFNCPIPKFISDNTKMGSEIYYMNVKKDLKIEIPTELFCALWSITVGYKSIVGYPFYINDCNVHLPDFSKKETYEILILTLLHTLITEKKNNYTHGRLCVKAEIIWFGYLTHKTNIFLNKYIDMKVGNETVGNLVKRIEKEDLTDLRVVIKVEINKRLERIGYWNCLPQH